MWKLPKLLWKGVTKLFSILLPFGKDPKSGGISTPAIRVLHFILLIAILVGLYFVNSIFFADMVGIPWARRYWLPIVFFLVYALMWTCWWIWKLLQTEPEASHFPDIDEAWDQALRALAQAGIRLGDLPLFLVLGRPQGPEEHLFAATQLQFAVPQTPSNPLAPLHIYATREAVYLTCAGASLLGKHAANVALEGIDVESVGSSDTSEEMTEDKTIRPSGKEKKVIKKLARILGRQMNVVERRNARRELGLPMPNLLKNPAEMELLRARLVHLGRLIVRDRQPFCPINGLLVLIPVGGTDTEIDAQQTADVCARDLATVRKVLQMNCPILVLCCDVEALPGFRDFIKNLSTKERLGRLGQRFPLSSPDLTGEALLEQMDKSIHHLCNNYLRDWVYRSFQVNPADEQSAITGNVGLYLFLDEMRGRKKNLSRIMTLGVAKDGPVPLLYAGCYLAGTGADKEREQAFVAGLFKRLLDNQSFVSWTDEALENDKKAQGQASMGCGCLGFLILLVLAGAAYTYFRKP